PMSPPQAPSGSAKPQVGLPVDLRPHPLPGRHPASPLPPPAVGAARKTSPGVTAVRIPGFRESRLPRLARRIPWRHVLTLVPVVLVPARAVQPWPVLVEGFGPLRDAPWPWLLAAGGATCLTWVAAAFTRQGAVIQPLPRWRLLATQLAAGSANHLLPTGL